MQRIDEDQMVNNAWTPSFCGYDGFGTVRQLTSFTGAVRDKYTVDAYGNAYDLRKVCATGRCAAASG
jgi:hypothetical protein